MRAVALQSKGLHLSALSQVARETNEGGYVVAELLATLGLLHGCGLERSGYCEAALDVIYGWRD